MNILIYVILGTVLGFVFSKKYKVRGGEYIYIITGIIGALLGELFSSAFIPNNIVIDVVISVLFSVILLYLFKIAVNKTN